MSKHSTKYGQQIKQNAALQWLSTRCFRLHCFHYLWACREQFSYSHQQQKHHQPKKSADFRQLALTCAWIGNFSSLFGVSLWLSRFVYFGCFVRVFFWMKTTAKKPRIRIRMWVEMNKTQAFYWGRPKTNSLFVLINKPHFCVLWETADFFVLFQTKIFFRSGFLYRPKSAASQ